MSMATIRIRTDEPDYSDIPEQHFDWAQSVYGDVREVLPENLPPPLGNYMTLTTYKESNLYHDMISGFFMTGILHLVNKTLFD